MNEGSNAQKMSLEDKLVDRIKHTELFALVGDEDALRKLTERAITEALYQPRRVPRQYGSFDEKDSPLVEATREVARKAADHVIAHIVNEVAKDPEFVKKCVEVVSTHLPMAVLVNLQSSVHTVYQGAAQRSIEALQQVVKNNGGQLPPMPEFGVPMIPPVREGLV